ncbi:MAG: orotidine-5'-phosphate decarboxylase [Ruminococcaceae bacterium]|nr:orotidine-5'-phosphate decarboxylase [Oscillospiraceae bacterium]
MSIDVLQAKIHKLKSPVMVGLDPSPALIPPSLIEGEGVAAMADAYERFCEGILEAVHGVAPAVKLQERCFLALGAEGVAVMQRLMEKAAKMGFYVLLDSNYASVEHISQLYADALFGENAPYTCDGVTVNGYLGGDNVKPFLPYCRDARKNLFCYVRTSNKSSREVQELISGDRLVYTAVTDLIMRWSTDLFAKNGYSEIAAVVGATQPDAIRSLRQKYDRIFLLVIGYGAQGGHARSVQYAFDRLGRGAIVSASRSILGAWQAAGDEAHYADCARAACVKMRDDILKYLLVI